MQAATKASLLRPREAAEWHKISERNLWTLTQRDELRCIRIGHSVRYDLADLVAFVDARKNGVNP